ncbi:hypothetical protein, partial [Mycobacteroides abscessus]|uniref:hypothetical protein n=1 Tax=Mycobacteroides abscessus TaxID=36809 RepID=UPI001A981AE8
MPTLHDNTLSVKTLSTAGDKEAAMVGRIDICIKNRTSGDELKPLEWRLSTAFCRTEIASAKTRQQLPTLDKVLSRTPSTRITLAVVIESSTGSRTHGEVFCGCCHRQRYPGGQHLLDA